MTKQEQRKYIKQVLRGKSDEYLAQKSKLVCERFATLPQFSEANTILAYMAMSKECDPALIVKKARTIGIAVAFPLCIEGNRIKICVPFDEKAFKTGAYGIWEPDESKSAILSPYDLDMIVVPGLGFDRNCGRLGRGAGYYDRLLAEAERAYKVGICFDEQLLDEVCTEAHDVKLDCVVTPSEIFC